MGRPATATNRRAPDPSSHLGWEDEASSRRRRDGRSLPGMRKVRARVLRHIEFAQRCGPCLSRYASLIKIETHSLCKTARRPACLLTDVVRHGFQAKVIGGHQLSLFALRDIEHEQTEQIISRSRNNPQHAFGRSCGCPKSRKDMDAICNAGRSGLFIREAEAC